MVVHQENIAIAAYRERREAAENPNAPPIRAVLNGNKRRDRSPRRRDLVGAGTPGDRVRSSVVMVTLSPILQR
jgi:hypothetical protein